jgi:hypothetical protein
MKRLNNIHKLLITGAGILSVVFLFSSCLKSRSGETDFSGLQPVVLIPEGGLAAFGSQALTFPSADASDTAVFHVNYAATNVAPANETVTLAVDQTALQTWNTNNPGAQYQLFPDSLYSFTSTSVTVTKGDNYVAVPVVVYPDKIDPTQSYMLPISIKAAPSGSTISGNFGTIWYHVIGNPIAGTYTWNWLRWNSADTSGAPNNTASAPQVFSPDNPTTVEVPSGYYNGPRYVITFDNNGGVLSNFSVSLNPADLTTWPGVGISLTGGPTIMVADPVNGYYQFTYSVSSGGNPRTLIDSYTR